MANALRTFIDRFLGGGESAVTVPPLDGALKPNNRLEEAAVGVETAEPDNLVALPDGLVYSSGTGLHMHSVTAGSGHMLRDMNALISAVAVSQDGVLAVAAGKGIAFVDASGQEVPGLSAGKQDWTGVTALAFAADGALMVAIGSEKNGLADWQRDLLDSERAGSVWRLDPRTGQASRLADRLAYPNGLMTEANGNVIVSEAWGKRLVRIGADGRMLDQVIEDLPGYPARISRSARGGYWLSIFAPRSQLIEFVLREPAYRKAMMAEVDKEFWVAPTLRSGYSLREPMQGGALKQMGILKPWAPTRSYGLVIELGPDFVPVRSFHSRAGGRRHGITSAVEFDGRLWATSKGSDAIVAVTLGGEGN